MEGRSSRGQENWSFRGTGGKKSRLSGGFELLGQERTGGSVAVARNKGRGWLQVVEKDQWDRKSRNLSGEMGSLRGQQAGQERQGDVQ